MRIIVATHNEGKLVEINRILEDCLGVDADQVELVSAGSLNLPDPVEDGVTFQETHCSRPVMWPHVRAARQSPTIPV
mgnify:CR=1 FL=1